MAIELIGSNLNTWGNNGNYETDPSTWGFGSTSMVTISRTSTYFSKHVRSLRAMMVFADPGTDKVPTALASFPVVSGKKYLAKAKVRCTTSNKPGEDEVVVRIGKASDTGLANIVYEELSIADISSAVNDWFDIQTTFDCLVSGTISNLAVQLILDPLNPSADALIPYGFLYVDEFEVYEYIDTEEEEPEPEPPAEISGFYFSKNHIPFTVAEDGVQSLLDNYRIYCDTRVEEISGSGDYVSALIQEQAPADGEAVFEVRQAFRKILRAAVTDYTQDLAFLTDRVKRFRNYYGHMSGDDTEPALILPSDTYLVMLGGIAKRKFPGLEYFTTYLNANKKFMTWAPIEKEVDINQEDYLNFIFHTAAHAHARIRLKIYYDDGTDGIQEPGVGGISFVKGQLVQWPAGPKNLSIGGWQPEKNVVKYDFWLYDAENDEIITEVRTYIIAKYHHPLTRYIMILNSLGAWEVHKFIGQSESKESYTREVVQKHLPHDYAATDGEAEGKISEGKVMRVLSSGFFKGRYSAQWLEYMRELARSAMLYDITTGDRVPLINMTKDFTFQRDRDYQRFIQIEAQEVYTDESFTPEDI